MAPPMHPSVVAVANLKGGVGKTTTTIHLGEAVGRSGLTVAVLDADPQASATKWGGRAEASGIPLAGPVIPLEEHEPVASALARIRAATGAQVIVIDTPPGAGDRDITRDAVALADGVVVPCRASIVEANELAPTLTLCRQAGTPAVVLRVAVDNRMSYSKGFARVLEGVGIACFRDAIPYNARMLEAGSGRPDKLYGYQFVWSEILGEDDGELDLR